MNLLFGDYEEGALSDVTRVLLFVHNFDQFQLLIFHLFF